MEDQIADISGSIFSLTAVSACFEPEFSSSSVVSYTILMGDMLFAEGAIDGTLVAIVLDASVTFWFVVDESLLEPLESWG
jgi:hypothetical protein